jgi:hypothetical protein
MKKIDDRKKEAWNKGRKQEEKDELNKEINIAGKQEKMKNNEAEK